MIKEEKQLQFIVERILDKRQRIGITEYLVLWKGYKVDKATWQPAQNLQHAKKRIRCFERKKKQQAKRFKKRQIKKQQILMQNTLYEQQKISYFNELKDLIKGDALEHSPIDQVLPAKSQDNLKPMTFQKFLNRPSDELVKVQRYNSFDRTWTQKLQTCGQIVGKNAARQLNRSHAYKDLITISSISIIEGHYIVRFQKGNNYFQAELQKLQYIAPSQIIDYILTFYDPSQKKLLREEDINQMESEGEFQDMSK